ncbi:hypothetical protein BDF21DRAFT_431849 [Thamnidium elegans]|uniref:Uncharacterized protein n=1 Tax=Thamnidium elegans TaxID=101142 RepID=A0A8H7SW27_9FUNG|nr:hypothetical protein INT48_003542 [Thamnidium elegans]KAI8052733.1 hypothetical protein BDF21DRAFT_431849 [Thamnidium elegans]
MSSSTTLAVPIFQSHTNPSHLPPTPTSSSSSLNTKNKEVARELSRSKYGSVSSSPYLESLNNSRPVTPSQTTISPNDDDESLYLIWTQELLRGLTSDQDKNDDDSSISDMSSVSSTDSDHAEYNAPTKPHNFLSSAPSTSYAYSHRDSMVSRYSSINVNEPTPVVNQNPISLFFHNCFSSCL